jgi:hypothetical protein
MRYNPCALVTAADVHQALGGEFSLVGAPEPGITGPFSERSCGYMETHATRLVEVQTQVDDKPSGTVWQANATYFGDNTVVGGVYEEISGLGDQAFYSSKATIVARKGVVVLTIDFVEEQTDGTTKEPLKALATTALSRVAG